MLSIPPALQAQPEECLVDLDPMVRRMKIRLDVQSFFGTIFGPE